MKKEYDFSKGIRGKFYVPENQVEMPIYLDKKINKELLLKSKSTGKTPTDIVNKILKKELIHIK